jgi:hypothetical protein
VSSPPFAAVGRAVSPHIGAIEGGRIAGPPGLGQIRQHGLPEAAARPPVEPVVDGGARPILRRTVAPAAAGGEHVQDAGDDLPVVLPLWSRLIPGHERFDHRPLLIREPEQVCHRHLQAAKRPPGITKPQTLQ